MPVGVIIAMADSKVIASQAVTPIPLNAFKPSRFAPVFAIIILLATTGSLAAIAFAEIEFGFYPALIGDGRIGVGILPTWVAEMYIAGITVMATVISIFTTGQIRRLWVYSKFRREAADDQNSRRQFSVLLGLGSWKDQAKTWHISLSFIFASLITTSIVTGVAPKTRSCIWHPYLWSTCRTNTNNSQ